MSKNTGGPAFPVADPFAFNPPTVVDAKRLAEGMTLRDYFAAKAMQGMLASPHATQDWIQKMAAGSAYGMADLMLAERAK